MSKEVQKENEFYLFDAFMKSAKNEIQGEWNALAADSLYYAIQELGTILRQREKKDD